MEKEIALTIKPTMSCNMRCKHCFNGDTFSQQENLDVNVACLTIEKACRSYDIVKVTFHGGEPTLAGIDYYKTFFQKEKELSISYGTSFRNFFTTNGVLLSDEFIDLLIQNDVMINISFDGPYNNILRSNTEIVKRNIFRILENKGKIRCYCTLSKESVIHLDEIYDWFKTNGISFKTLPIERMGFAKDRDDLIMSSETLVENLCRVYKYWLKDKSCFIHFYTFEEFSRLRRTNIFKPVWFNREIAINPDGKLYPFGRPNDIRYCLGSPYDINRLDECFNSEQYRLCLNDLDRLKNLRCPNCPSNITCGGVVINISNMYYDDPSLLDYSCNQSNLIFQSILKINDIVIQDFLNGNTNQYNQYAQKSFSEFSR